MMNALALTLTAFLLTACGGKVSPVARDSKLDLAGFANQDLTETRDFSFTLKNPIAVSSGGRHTCAIDDEGVKCWGLNDYSQTNVPSGLKNPKAVSSGDAHTCGIDDEGVKCWGWNDYGQTNVP